MSALSESMMVGELLDASRRAALVFEVVGIDMCCGQAKTLPAASAAAHISAGEVLDLIEGRATPPCAEPGSGATLSQITHYIVNRLHRSARAALTELVELSRQVCSAHADDTLWGMKDGIDQLVRELVPHMRGEERYHFRYIDSMQSPSPDQQILVPLYGSLRFPLQSLRHDHSRDVTAMSDLRSISSGFTAPAAACPAVRRLYELLETFDEELKDHVRLEDETLFPLAIEMEKKLARY